MKKLILIAAGVLFFSAAFVNGITISTQTRVTYVNNTSKDITFYPIILTNGMTVKGVLVGASSSSDVQYYGDKAGIKQITAAGKTVYADSTEKLIGADLTCTLSRQGIRDIYGKITYTYILDLNRIN